MAGSPKSAHMPFVFDNKEPLRRIKVYVRLRPVQKPSPTIHIEDETGTILVDVVKLSGGGPPRSTIEQISFTVDDIIKSTNQQRVYERCAKASIDEFLNGYNATIFAFGQVGSGKTYTMVGDTKIHIHRGFIARSIGQVMEEKHAHPEAGIVVWMSYLEIYEERMYDLLQRRSTDLMIIEENGLVDVRGLTKIQVETEAQAIKWFNEGEKSRSYGHHLLNQQSSRSHIIFTLYMERRVGRFHTEYDTIVSKLNLVDLAGVEHLKKTNIERGGQMRKEACTINKSISYLETIVYYLSQGQAYVPFRQGKASILLKESLGGNCKTVVMICMWLEDCFYDESINSLRFAQKVKCLKTYPFRNKKLDCATTTKRRHLQQIANLQQEVALKDALQGQPSVFFGDLTEEIKNKLREAIQEFLQDDQNDESLERIPIDNLKQVKELFCLFKEAQNPLREEYERISLEYGMVPPIDEPSPEEPGVGELTIHGFHVGIAPLNARPDQPNASLKIKWKPDEIRCGQTMLDYKEMDPKDDVWESGSVLRNDAFDEYKHTNAKGREQEAMSKVKERELKTKKQYAKDLCDTCNDMKHEIQTIKRIINEKKDTKDFKLDVDKCKTNLYKRLKILKADYHKTFNEVELVKDLIERLTQEVKDRKEGFLKSFYSWFDAYDKEKKVTTEEYLASL